jgi:hypothetical protein
MILPLFVVATLAQDAGALAPLSASQIQTVVAAHSADIKHDCWENSTTHASDVTVKLDLTIAANGRVTNTHAGGSDATVAQCIGHAASAWTFPQSTGSTNVSVPFHFIRSP